MIKHLCSNQNICISSSLINSFDQGIMILDSEGTAINVNSWFTDTLGYESYELEGLSHAEIYKTLFSQGSLDFNVYTNAFKMVMLRKKKLKFKRSFTDKAGNIIAVESQLSPMIDKNGNSIGVVVIVKEIKESLLYNIAKNLNSSLALKDVLKTTNEEIVSQLGLSSNAIFLLDEESSTLELAVCTGWKDEELNRVKIKVGEGVPGLIAKENRPIYVENLRTDPRIHEVARRIHSDKSSIGYPMYFKNTLLGVVTFDAYNVRAFSLQELKLFNKIADLVSMVVYNSQVYERLVLAANTDGLTGLMNHRHFQEILKEEMDVATKDCIDLSLIMVDLENFKAYNNIFGYSKGDELLRKIAMSLKEFIGIRGVVARFGGDEFAILLPKTGAKEASLIAEALGQHVEETYLNQITSPLANSSLDVRVSTSFGIANYPAHATNKEELVTYSCHALNQAKKRNQDKVVVYFSLLDDLMHSLDKDEKELVITIKTFMRIINAKDNYTVGHSERVTEYALLIGNELGLSEGDMTILRYGSYLHDIGKIEISREILNKPGKLTDAEFSQIKGHPQNGVDLLTPIKSLKSIIPIVKYHHERYDGKGYPSGLKGQNIPFLARIVCVADSFDAIISSRPYRSAQSIGLALTELEKCAGTQFDPDIVEVFAKILREQYCEHVSQVS